MMRLILLTTLAVAPGAFAQSPTPSLVDVGGRKVNVQVMGASKPNVPTVIFELGFGSPIATWNPVQMEIASTTKTIAYERAGIGASEPSKDRRTVKQFAVELHALLAALKAPPPYVLVGHSYGGPIIHTFAATYPNEIAGL